MLAKYTDGLSLVVTRDHSCVLLTRPWISKTLVDEIILCFSDKRKFTLYRTMDIKRIFELLMAPVLS